MRAVSHQSQRPPLTGEYEAVLATNQFIESKFIVEDDARLMSQVELWSITRSVFVTFGTDIHQPVPSSLVGKIQRFCFDIETIRFKWNERFKPHMHIGNYPRKGVGLHCHFAKLYLCSHAFRGISTGATDGIETYEMSFEMHEVADTAILSATSILRSINVDREFQSFMSDLPLYFDTMIAFAAVFLFRISTTYSHVIQVDTEEILRLLRRSVNVLENIASTIRPAHILARISGGLRQLLGQFEEARLRADQATEPGQSFNPDVEMNLPESIHQDQFDGVGSSSFDGFSIENYDFLSNHQMTSGYEVWPMDSIQ